jgi:RimJ/RimL family protein N-acetyltransferase
MIAFDPLADDIIRIRRWRQSDAQTFLEACEDADVRRWCVGLVPPADLAEAEVVIECMDFGLESGKSVHLAVEWLATGDLCGAVELDLIVERQAAEIGYWTAARYRGRGVSRSAVLLLSRWALRDLGVARVEALVHTSNAVSQRLVESCGFVREGVLRSFHSHNGCRGDYTVSSLLPSDVRDSRVGPPGHA